MVMIVNMLVDTSILIPYTSNEKQEKKKTR